MYIWRKAQQYSMKKSLNRNNASDAPDKLQKKICGAYGLSLKHFKTLKRLDTPKKIQDFLDRLPVNLELGSETYMSVERTLNIGKAHCIEGAMVAALALWMQGQPPLLLDLKSYNGDDHIVALYRRGGRWGAVSKTNHATLRFRDPVYQSVRELAMSYFHEYIHLKTGEKILESYSEPFDLRKIVAWRDMPGGTHVEAYSRPDSIGEWISGREELFWLAEAIDYSPHHAIYPAASKKHLRKADHMELKAGNIIEWKSTDKGV